MTVAGQGRGWRLALLAGALAILGTLVVPVADPHPGAVARAASTDLTITGDAVYTVLPEAGRVHVDVDLTARYRKAETRTQKFYVTLANLAVLPGTKNFKVTGWKGTTVRVTKRTATFTMVRITFGSHLFGGQTHALRLSFDLPDPGRNVRAEVRIGPSLVTFPVWAFASDGAHGGSASVRFPAGYDVAVESGSFADRSTAADGSTILDSGQLVNPLSFFAYVSGQKPAEFVDSPLIVDAGGQSISDARPGR